VGQWLCIASAARSAGTATPLGPVELEDRDSFDQIPNCLIAPDLQLTHRNSSTILGQCASTAADIAALHVPLAGFNRRKAVPIIEMQPATWTPIAKMPPNLRSRGEVVVGTKLEK
jgi:hypothetical protein